MGVFGDSLLLIKEAANPTRSRVCVEQICQEIIRHLNLHGERRKVEVEFSPRFSVSADKAAAKVRRRSSNFLSSARGAARILRCGTNCRNGSLPVSMR
jgi:hypothetical protein